MTYTGDWSPGPLEDQLGLIAVRIAAWNHGAGPEDVPEAGDHNADAITAGHAAVKAIDDLARQLSILRSRLRTEMQADEAARAKRVDAMLRDQDETGGDR